MVNLITDPTFDCNDTERYNLSIQVGLDGFSFSITDRADNRLVAFQTEPVLIGSETFLERRFREWAKNNSLLAQKYASVKIVYPTINYSIIPGKYYNFEKQRTLAKFLFPLPEDVKIIDNYLPYFEANLIFSIPEALYLFALHQYPEHQLLHPVTAILARLDPGQTEPLLVLYFCKSSFCLLLFHQNKLLCSNSYNHSHPNDMEYYILSVLKQQDLNFRDINLWLSGTITSIDEEFNALSRHFTTINFLSPGKDINQELFTLPPHRYA